MRSLKGDLVDGKICQLLHRELDLSSFHGMSL